MMLIINVKRYVVDTEFQFIFKMVYGGGENAT